MLPEKGWPIGQEACFRNGNKPLFMTKAQNYPYLHSLTHSFVIDSREHRSIDVDLNLI